MRLGILSPVVVCADSFTHPTRYSGAHDWGCHWPSIAESFGAWFFVTSIAICAPKMKTWRTASTVNHLSASERFFFANSRCCFFIRYHALTESTSADPMIHEATQVWRSRGRKDGV